MKKIFPLFLFFVFISECQISFAQVYHPFPDTLAQWSEGSYYNGMCCFGEGYMYALAGDTVVDNTVYTLLGFNNTYSWQTYNWPYSSENFSYTIPGQIFGAIREDSSKKIWFRSFGVIWAYYCTDLGLLPADSDILLYDFGLSVGDTAQWGQSSYYQVLQKIDSFQLLNGTWRREFVFDSLNQAGKNWIEGIGALAGLFGPYQYDPFEGGCSLHCFQQADTMLYEEVWYPQYDCNHIYTGSMEIKPENSISIFPNPATNSITFDLSHFPIEKFTLTIYNSGSQQVISITNPHSNQLQIPVSQLGADGLYFYTLTIDEKRIFSGKFLVQRE